MAKAAPKPTKKKLPPWLDKEEKGKKKPAPKKGR